MAKDSFLAPAAAWIRTDAIGANVALEMPLDLQPVWQTGAVSLMAHTQSKTAKRWFVSGGVQGVGYRAFAQSKATSLGVSGWVRYLSDGRVEVYGVGTPDRLDDLAAALHLGPRLSKVRNVEEQDASVDVSSGFSIR